VRTAERAVLVGIVVAVGAALRWGFVATAVVQSPLRVDAGQYAQYAKNLVEHGVYSLATTVPPPPDSFRSPGYPLLLALCRLFGGDAGWYALAIALQVVLGTATVLLCYRLARHWLLFPIALSAAALCALSPHLVVAGAYVLTECTTTFALLAGLVLLVPERGRWRLLGAGAVLGYAALCNEALVVVPMVLVWPLWRARGAGPAIAFVIAALLPLLIWNVRNASQDMARTGGERATASISHGSYPGMVFRDPRLLGFPYREDPEQPVFGQSWSGLRSVLGRRIAAEPWRYLSWYALEKPVWLWGWDLVQGRDVLVYEVGNSPYERQPVMVATHSLMRQLHAPCMLLAAVAASVLAWNRRRRWPFAAQALGLVALAGTLAYLPVIPDPRYMQPIRPVLFVLGAAAVGGILQWGRSWLSRRGSPPVAAAAANCQPSRG
jgi:4-amino-4-deoxy-L-arabinose transferase-like glycosyltransferase